MCKICESDYSLIVSDNLGDVLGNRIIRYVSMLKNIEKKHMITVISGARDNDYLDTMQTAFVIKYCPFCGREL